MTESDGTESDGAEKDAAPPPREIDPRLLESLVCPVTHGPLEFDRARNELVSRKARLAYPIRDAVPILLVHEAREIGD